MTDKPKQKRSRKQNSGIDEKTKKLILEEERVKLERVAEKIALKTMTELQLATQAPLSDDQKKAVKMLASGKTFDEVAESLRKPTQAVIAWMGQPSFSMAVNEATIKEGLSDKNERIRKAKRIAEALNDKMIEKIDSEEINRLPISTLSQLAMLWSQRVDTLVDKKESDLGSRDLTVLILNHVQGNNGKKYDKIEDFLTDSEFSYPTIDVVPERVDDERK